MVVGHNGAWRSFLAVLLCAMSGLPAVAQEAGNEAGPSPAAYEQLLERLQAAEQQIEQLHERQAAMERLPAVDGSEPEVWSVPTLQEAPSAPTYPTVRLSGFFHLDAGLFDQDAANRLQLGDIQDGIGFRRARLQAVGSVAAQTQYSIEMDFATAGRPSFMDVWGEQNDLPLLGNVRIGHFRQPFSMDALTSVRQLEFLERSLPFQAFVPFRRVGIMAYDKSFDERTQWAYGIYRTGGFNNAPLGDSRFGVDIGDHAGFSFSTRASHLLYYDAASDGGYLLHIGGSYNYSRISAASADERRYQARVIPEFFVGDPAGGGLTAAGTPFFADTGAIPASDMNLLGVELAWQRGPLHVQAEYMGTIVNQIGGPSLYYDGAYVQGGYFLTGEHRTYNTTNGALDKVVPAHEFHTVGRQPCGWGAWEVTARVSYVNLNDPGFTLAPTATVPPSPNPGRLTDTTLGLNWFWNAYTQVQFNWIHCFLDNAATGDSDCDIFAARFQLGF